MVFETGDTIEITNERFRIVSGFANVEIKDLEGHVVSALELAKAMVAYMVNGGHVLYGHANIPVGRVIYWDLRKHDDSGALGVYIVAVIEKNDDVQDAVWDYIKKGIIKGFSIGGRGRAQDIEIEKGDGTKELVKRVVDITLKEISLVEVPANQLAIIDQYNEFAKSYMSGLMEIDNVIKELKKETLIQKSYIDKDIKYMLNYFAKALSGVDFDEANDVVKEFALELALNVYSVLAKAGDVKDRYMVDGHFKEMTCPDDPNEKSRFCGCVRAMMATGKSLESAKKICGKIKERKYGN